MKADEAGLRTAEFGGIWIQDAGPQEEREGTWLLTLLEMSLEKQDWELQVDLFPLTFNIDSSPSSEHLLHPP